MVGCNCASVGSMPDPACCVVAADKFTCDPVVSRDYYCGFCEQGLAAVGCHVWVSACEFQRRLVRLSIVRFKLQTGRDSVFTALQDLNVKNFSTYSRFPSDLVIDLNNPRIFSSLVSLVSAASFKDRMGEKMRGSFDHWSYDDALTAFHKSLGTIKKTIKGLAVSRNSFERRYGLKWLPAGSPVVRLSDSPTLYAMDKALESSCLHPFAGGAFFVLPDSTVDKVQIDDNSISFPNRGWNHPIECDGAVAIPRSDGSIDIYKYHYECRQFTFIGPIKSIPGTLADLQTMLEAFKAVVAVNDNAACPFWANIFLDTVKKRIEANKSKLSPPTTPGPSNQPPLPPSSSPNPGPTQPNSPTPAPPSSSGSGTTQPNSPTPAIPSPPSSTPTPPNPPAPTPTTPPGPTPTPTPPTSLTPTPPSPPIPSPVPSTPPGPSPSTPPSGP